MPPGENNPKNFLEQKNKRETQSFALLEWAAITECVVPLLMYMQYSRNVWL